MKTMTRKGPQGFKLERNRKSFGSPDGFEFRRDPDALDLGPLPGGVIKGCRVICKVGRTVHSLHKPQVW